MSDIVSNEEIGALAAEFVLGTLGVDERGPANELLERDGRFRDVVRVWERRFGELHLMVEPVEPPGPVWDRIRAKIGIETKPEEGDAKIAAAEVGSEMNQPEAPPAKEAQRAEEPELTLDALEAELRQSGLARPDSIGERSPETVELGKGTSAATTPQAAERASLTPAVMPEQGQEPVVLAQHRRPALKDPHSSVRLWRLAAIVMAITALMLGALVVAWRYAPEHLPPQLQATNFLNMRTPAPPQARTPVRPAAPPESRFDE